MNKTEKFIQESTKRCSDGVRPFEKWLTPDQARKAVEIAREELLEEICVWLKHLQVKPTYFDVDWIQREWFFERDKLIEDFINYMKGE